MKILIDIEGGGGGGGGGDAPMIKCNIGKISKTHSPTCLKNTFSEVFCIKFFAFNIKWTNWSQHQLIDVDCCFAINFRAVYLVKTHSQLISPNPM